MSNLSPLSLPRFHVNALTQAKKGQSGAAPDLVAEDGFDLAQEEAAADLTPDTEVETQAELPAAAMPPEIDTGTILNRLETALADLERIALEQSQKSMTEFLRGAFPHLCETLLAEEVAAATKAMAPAGVSGLTIQVPASFESAFQRALQHSPEMTEICELQTGDQDAIIVEVDWETGGLQFDMDAFLESSLRQLAGPTHMQEGHDV
ncbi:MAG: hypothetical protein AAF437_14565 [Pseudomonadota bacterium]